MQIKFQIKALVSAVLLAFALGSCTNMTKTQKHTTASAGVAREVVGNVWSKRMQAQKKQMEEATAGTGVNVTQTSDNRLKLDIPSDISFDVGRAVIKRNFRAILDTFAKGLVSNPTTTVQIIGHTDGSGSDDVNNPLSFNRAIAARDYLSARGVVSTRFAIDGRGSREPIVANDTAANKAKNRRVEIFVAEPAQTTALPAS
jgi:outer membrane protein OmpA-like peptidoglycan-associated protein